MMRRGSTYWLWADCELHCRSHDELQNDGTLIDVQTRVSRKGRTQLFIGVYDKNGSPLFGEAHDCLPHDTMTTALAWGVSRAREIASGNLVMNAQSDTNHIAASDSQRTTLG